jgi:two-component system, LytTR family, response regulator
MTTSALPMRVVVAEDEPLAAEALARELRQLGCDVVAITGTGDAALHACVALRPHCCVADVIMPGRDGLALARALRLAAPSVRVLFVTAHPEYAVDAFAEEVVDFVPKPVRRARLADAIARVRRSVTTGDDEPRLLVGERGAMHVLAVRDIEWVQSDGPLVWLHTAHRAWAQRDRMQQLEARLSPHGFLRVHRTALIRLAAVTSFMATGDREATLVLKSGTRVRVARDRIALVRDALAALVE